VSHCFVVIDATSLLIFAIFIIVGPTEAAVDRRHPACRAPIFPTKAAATVSDPSAIASRSAARRRAPVRDRHPARAQIAE